ncbi:Major facilitator superfamily domain general substrate transporter [Penicillium fimorum]|uniref:Major facilitator superfamily domain general substrate transporter n=1 Tax=Penicillium fimorum TaxID=1882269 RepID=A0A9W9XW33_9EURO|nr:Major facilitator superfamily domain general substrate transporter [Penicillium fimorum]
MATSTMTQVFSLGQQQKKNQPPTASERIIDPLNIKSSPDTEPNYPTGTKFWFTTISLCVVLILGGLPGRQHRRYSRAEHHQPLPHRRRCGMVLV